MTDHSDCPNAEFHGRPHRYCQCGWVEPRPERHPATQAMLDHFAYEHLPQRLRVVSKPFGLLAAEVADTLAGPEATVCLRKLLEAKDCAVRAAVVAAKEG